MTARPARQLRARRNRPARWPLVVLLALLLAITGCTTTSPAEPDTTTGGGSGTPTPSTPVTSPGPGDLDEVRIAVVGDSITVGSDPTFAPGQVSEDSWVSYAVGDPIELVGGWARWGATTEEMAAAAAPVDADVLVILAGTNDLAAGTPTEQVAANLEQIVAAVGAGEVLLCAVPPLDARPEVVPPFNEFLRAQADSRGWAWVDPAAGIRSEDRFEPGMSVDGVHPTQTGATQIGAEVRGELLSQFASAAQG